MNIELLKKVRDRIKEVGPEKVDMGTWVNGTLRATGETGCDTVGCFAGWIMAVKYGVVTDRKQHIGRLAAEAIGVAPSGYGMLFYRSGWPTELVGYDKNDYEALLIVIDALIDGSWIYRDVSEYIEVEGRTVWADEGFERAEPKLVSP